MTFLFLPFVFLQSDVSVLCTIPIAGRGRPLPLVEEIRRSFQVFTVTKDNRNSIGNEIQKHFL
jgi:nucleoside-triphosphatase THEP1